ncbi:hypothetical protein L313_1198 [Acinetobacter haemolyticus CIP 64.3 = MTCC 9819]|uniref:Uncharacterized protein n=1 Tax=Acinetobacter haemolyticus CIP 64.3 = MTCC 9819 TaxID=1217659 RepID=N9FHM9_ACIHA|nr:hypothetical protein [Acinetobacter haemolyticus]ENW22052.1 hypothetical protein F927_00155 [Acinetobacter haemolyticus CIP 64.3 = MTCC 9819]EPR89510.1 hypothetical protein L313_1198 [Acinetobacter haemolyticus CIP 64.3 = MTCC 9819]QXZ28061.1 hypothetical protein I6L22_07330 [Acinetobacter haemolyticus]SPT49090.1 Uncharacterised protein [Acinetobacter haemolyticus]SUU55682.1 Uncharacterised protein [Acinetobacter haemolyticus]
MTEEKMVEVFVPALVTLFIRAEEIAKRPLSKEEILRIRDSATVIMTPLSVMPALLKSRGYHDLYAPEVWEQWQLYREGELDLSVR